MIEDLREFEFINEASLSSLIFRFNWLPPIIYPAQNLPTHKIYTRKIYPYKFTLTWLHQSNLAITGFLKKIFVSLF